MATDENGELLFAFHLYDANGRLIAESGGFQKFPDGITVKCAAGEQLLHVPDDPAAPLEYRLYNSDGLLLTFSDGQRTKIYPHLRMDGMARGWTLPDS